MQIPDTPRLVTARAAAKRLGIPYTSLRDLAFAGAIDPIKVGRAWYFDTRDLDQLIDRLKERVGSGRAVRIPISEVQRVVSEGSVPVMTNDK